MVAAATAPKVDSNQRKFFNSVCARTLNFCTLSYEIMTICLVCEAFLVELCYNEPSANGVFVQVIVISNV